MEWHGCKGATIIKLGIEREEQLIKWVSLPSSDLVTCFTLCSTGPVIITHQKRDPPFPPVPYSGVINNTDSE